jgi:RNA recognition motif-containing protein
MPYAFNYHFDGGNFRGLAFANFRSGEEADAVVAALNGFDVAGRKLRVEYKKVLQAGEKERIEKEKAIKRMHSMQLEKERSRHEQQQHWGALPPNPPLPHEHQQQQHQYDQYDQYSYAVGAPPQQPQMQQSQQQQHQLPSPSLEIHPSAQLPQQPRSPLLPLTADSLRAVPAARQGAGGDSPSEVSGGASSRAKDGES